MADPNVDGNQDDLVGGDQPVPVPSGPSASAPSPAGLANDADLVARIAALEKELPEVEVRAVRKAQSITDATLAKKLKGFEEAKAALDKAGGDPLKAALQDVGAPPSPVGTETPEARERVAVMQAETSILLSNAGIPPADPEYLALVKKWEGQITSADAWKRITQTFVETRGKQARPPNPAAAFAEPPKSMSDKTAQQELDELTANLEKLQQTARPGERMEERAQLRARLRELTQA
jgi:hypothetical protein